MLLSNPDASNLGASRADESLTPVAANALSRPRIVIAGGGTGGHLVPGISLARELGDTADVIFFCTGKPLEEKLIDAAGFPRRQLPAGRLSRNPLALPFAAWKLGRGFLAARHLLREECADVVVGLGGFGAAAPALAARTLGIPLVLLEQNVLPGRTNRLLARFANSVQLQWDEAREHLGSSVKANTVGSPLRGDVAELASTETRRSARMAGLDRFGLQSDRVTLLVTGGSQGALGVNRLVREGVAGLMERARSSLQVLHLAGANENLDELRRAYAELLVPASVHSFLHDMPTAYAVADLAIARAGGTTLAELAAAGIPAILLPYPHAANRHQHANAQAFARGGAGLVLEEEGLSPARLARELEGLLIEPYRRVEMARAALRLGRPAAGADIARVVLELSGVSPSSETKGRAA